MRTDRDTRIMYRQADYEIDRLQAAVAARFRSAYHMALLDGLPEAEALVKARRLTILGIAEDEVTGKNGFPPLPPLPSA